LPVCERDLAKTVGNVPTLVIINYEHDAEARIVVRHCPEQARFKCEYSWCWQLYFRPELRRTEKAVPGGTTLSNRPQITVWIARKEPRAEGVLDVGGPAKSPRVTGKMGMDETTQSVSPKRARQRRLSQAQKLRAKRWKKPLESGKTPIALPAQRGAATPMLNPPDSDRLRKCGVPSVSNLDRQSHSAEPLESIRDSIGDYSFQQTWHQPGNADSSPPFNRSQLGD
jgi:hypothetical protein